MLNRQRLGLAAGLAVAAALTAGAMIAASSNAYAQAAPSVGFSAPSFTATTSAGTTVSLADFSDKTVVLEWTNHDCPYVKKHYSTNNMQGLQTAATAADVVWLQVISSAPGKQGYLDGPAADAKNAERGAAPTAVLLDPTGELGRLYDARTTPHMFVIDAGVLAYSGAIDDKATANPSDVPIAVNFVTAALTALANDAPVEPAETRSYGCSVKYDG